MGTDTDKSVLRRDVERAIEALGADERRHQSGALTLALERWMASTGFEVVLATLPLGYEPDLTPVLARWVGHGKGLALARTVPQRSMDFGFVGNLDGPWEHRPFGLREPPRSALTWTPGRPTLCLVPGLAFASLSDGTFARLGRGGGYYDRWLEAHGREVFTMGVGYSVQRLLSVPSEAHDKRLWSWLGPDGVEIAPDYRARIPSQKTE